MKPGDIPDVLFPHEIWYACPYVSVTVCWSTAGQEKVGLGPGFHQSVNGLRRSQPSDTYWQCSAR